MRWFAIIRSICALACALAFHAALVEGAACFGWFSPETTTLPELDLTSVDLSFSETPDESAAPATPPPQPAVEPPPPPVVEPPAPPIVEPPPPPIVEPPPPPIVEPPPPPPQPIVEPLPDPPQPVIEIPPPPPPQPVVEPPPPQPATEPPPLQPVEEPQLQQPVDEPQPPVAEPTPPEPTPEPQPPSIEIPPAPAPSQARIAVDKPPVPRRRIRPEYPKGARERGEEGDVTLELEISAAGTVDGVRVIASCGFPELEQSAIQTVKRARFEPARRGTAKVPSTARLTLTFRLKH